MSKRHLVVVDDFYPDPAAIRRDALAVPYGPAGDGSYPGQNSVRGYCTPAIMQAFSVILGNEVRATSEWSNGHFRLSYADSAYRQDIHHDPIAWSGIIYLNPPEQCCGGTAFWRHKASGTDDQPTMVQRIVDGLWRVDGVEPGDLPAARRWVRAEVTERQGLDRSLWEQSSRVVMRFNRLVLFRSANWHSHLVNFGSKPEDGRLIQTFFFHDG